MSAPVQYHEYLGLDAILASQNPISWKKGTPAHDEMLFIITHQAYELWFKQILTEVDSILGIFAAQKVDENQMGVVVSRLERVHEIFKLLVHQIDVIETMTPLDFLDFRNLLFPASGFQSFQFRVFEIKMGLKMPARMRYNDSPYFAHFPEKQSQELQEIEKSKSLFECVQEWLERTPFLSSNGFNFWTEYQTAVRSMLDEERAYVSRNPLLSDADKARNFEQMNKSDSVFQSLFEASHFQKLRESGQWRLSLEAVRAALFIQVYRDQPVLHLPFRFLYALMSLDETITQWRYRHALMAKRMLGAKIGTGGSSGHDYLRESTEKHKLFSDLNTLTTYLIPRKALPKLPLEMIEKLGFHYDQKS